MKRFVMILAGCLILLATMVQCAKKTVHSTKEKPENFSQFVDD